MLSSHFSPDFEIPLNSLSSKIFLFGMTSLSIPNISPVRNKCPKLGILLSKLATTINCF